ncbi:MAG TPA: 6-carboxytetrahydropterin synthase QueD [Spirochaetota bacterium]|nr:6-carboxytetrahydropterin synthase QueD [Spirochaetota bacterium]
MKRYELTVEDHFSSAHQLRGYMGRCENIHGHNWRVKLRVTGSRLDNIGLLVDFGILKNKLKEVLSRLDHVNLNDTPPFNSINPSSENIAEHICTEVQSAISEEFHDVTVFSVTVWESQTSSCTFYPEIRP